MLRSRFFLSAPTRIGRFGSRFGQKTNPEHPSTSSHPSSVRRIALLAFGGLTASLCLGTITQSSLAGSPPNLEEEEPISSLVRTYVVYSICSFPLLVRSSPMILSVLGSIPGVNSITEWVVRKTFFNQFVGGETAESTLPVISKYRAQHKGTLFGYSVEVDEGKGGEPQWSSNVEEMIHSINIAGDFEDSRGAKGPDRKTWVAFKLTALLPSADSLARMSSHLLNARPRDRLTHYPGTPRSTDLDVLNAKDMPADSPLTVDDMAALKRLKVDLERICARADVRGVRILIDAEHTWYQAAIDAFQLAMMRQFNNRRRSHDPPSPNQRDDDDIQPLVYGTYQSYLRRNAMHLIRNIEAAEREGYSLGIKLVRGAYHSQEHPKLSPYQPDVAELRKIKGLPRGIDFAEGPFSAVWDEKRETDVAYDATAGMLLDFIKNGAPIAVLFATHNEKSCDRIIAGLLERGLAIKTQKNDTIEMSHSVAGRVAFAQLYGMCDPLTNRLATTVQSSSPVVLKYVPYGALSDVIPYLGRRAIENQSVLGAKEGGAACERAWAMRKIRQRLLG